VRTERKKIRWRVRAGRIHRIGPSDGGAFLADTTAAALRTATEFADEVRALSVADWLRLRKAARYYSRPARMESADLLQEAFARAVQGSRNCPVDVTPVQFLKQTMRSIANGVVESPRHKVVLVPIAKDGPALRGGELVDPTPNPEAVAIEQQSDTAMVAELIALFADDVVAQTILEGIMEGVEGEELRALVGLDEKAYASKRRLMRRRIDSMLARSDVRAR
jgi:hypothetical protein